MRNHHLLILVLAGAMLWSAENWAKAADPTAKGTTHPYAKARFARATGHL